ncbi:MAG TPA: DnaA N-terminal domain-containing protein, partial [Rhodospirillales bacterium]|nr:DnaA N-terminal domain-containing protein [Rhodospirillales bacterium]
MAENGTFLDSQWQRVSGLLRAEIGEAAYRSWLRPMSVCGERDGCVTLKVPTRFMRDWVVAHYADRMRALWGGENPKVQGINIVVEAERAPVNGRELNLAVGAAGAAAG